MMKALGDDFERVVCGQGEAFLDMAEKERESVLSEARTQTQFLDSPALREVLTKSSFRLAELKGEQAAQRVPVPAGAAHGHARPLAARHHQSGRSARWSRAARTRRTRTSRRCCCCSRSSRC